MLAVQPPFGAQLLVLVIASHKPVSYQINWAVWRELRTKHSDVQVYMLVADPMLATVDEVLVDEENHTIFVKTDESYRPGVLLKTVKALNALLNDPRRRFTHILRTNLSSMWHWGRLLRVLNNDLPPNGDFIAGFLMDDESPLVETFVSGAGMLMTRGVAKMIVEHAHGLQYELYDDLSIGVLMERLQVERISLPRCDFTNNTLPMVLDADPTCFHYRVKNRDVNEVSSRAFYDGYIFSRLYFELYS